MDRKLGITLLAITVAACGGGSGSKEAAPPAIPAGLTASYDGGPVTIAWDAQPGTQYDLYYSSDRSQATNGYALYENSGMVPNAASPITLSSLPSAPVYYFMIKAKADGKESPASAKAWVVTRYDYQGSNDELVHDKVSGLTWRRCLEGQSWNNTSKTCTGTTSELNGNQAAALFTPNADGWRIPTEAEIGTLAFCNAASPPYFRPANDTAITPCAAANEDWRVYLGAWPNGSTARNIYTTKTLTTSDYTAYCGLKLGELQAAICGAPAASLRMYALLVKSDPS